MIRFNSERFSNKESMIPVRICAVGLTVYEIPKALEVAGIVVVQETDLDQKNWCKVVVKDPEVARLIKQKFRWDQDEKSAQRYEVAGFFKVMEDENWMLKLLNEFFPKNEFISGMEI